MTESETAALLDALLDPAILVDHNRRILAANNPARDLFGTFIPDSDLSIMLRHPAALDAVDAVLAGAPFADATITQAAPIHLVFELHVTTLPSETDDGARVFCLLRDVTVAREAERLRADFVSNVSHELRSPLSSLIGFIETLQGPARDDDEARDRFLGIMDGEAKRMARLVDDLLSLSRVESGEHILPVGSVALSKLLAAVIDAVATRAEARGMMIDLDLSPDLPQVTGDEDELMEVFHNLIENAVKYGPSGTQVTIKASPLARIPDVGEPGVRVAINNRGELIAPQHLPRLTERFYRIDKGRSRDMGGTGLGLAIVKHIVSHHRGRLTIDSDVDQGNTFTVFLPLRR